MLSIDEVADFAYDNRLAMRFRMIALEDYIATRLCMLNGILPQGIAMAEQAIEKELKSILLVYDPEFDWLKHRRHSLVPLIQKVQEFEDLGLSKYQLFCEWISDIYELGRYPDSRLEQKVSSWGISGEKLNEIDEFIFYINEVSPIPNLVKFHSGLYVKLFEKSQVGHSDHNWLVAKNKAFFKRQNALRQQFEVKWKYGNKA